MALARQNFVGFAQLLHFSPSHICFRMSAGASGKPTIIVEHLDPELEEWQALEYKCIYEECETSTPPWNFLLSGLSSAAGVGKQLSLPSSSVTEQSVEALYQGDRRRNVCLLDPKAEKDLSPEDGEKFDVFLFGGILGDDPPRGMHFDQHGLMCS